jgi:hypothetical protein
VEVAAPTAVVGVEAFTAAVVEVSTVAVVAVSEARGVVAADIVEEAHSEVRDLSVEVGTAAAALVADQPRAATERAGTRTADLAHRAVWAEEAAGFNRAAIPAHSEIVLRASILQ